MSNIRPLPEGIETIPQLVELLQDRLRAIGDTASAQIVTDLGGRVLQNAGNPVRLTDVPNVGYGDQRWAKKGEVGAPGPAGPPGAVGPVTVKKTAGLTFTGASARVLEEKLGEHVSVLDFGVVGDGVADDTAALQQAIDSVSARGGGILWIPGGYTLKLTASVEMKADVHLVGQGDTSVLSRGAAIADNKGLIHSTASRWSLEDLKITGNVTTTAGLQYGVDFDYTAPAAVILTKNSSIWAVGCSDVLIQGVTVEHTGGYAMILDCRTADVDRVTVRRCRFQNNRPHKMGTAPGALNFGCITGGIFAIGDGTNHRSADVLVTECVFARSTGNQVWTWAPAFAKLHTNWVVTNNSFIDIGRDCVLLGAINNGVINDNTARRIGYMPPDDTAAAVPRWLNGHWAVAFDTSGVAINCQIANNAVLNCIGGCFDLDGFSQGSITNNVGRVSHSGEAEYTEDAVGTWTNQCYGINVGDTANNVGGVNVACTGNYFDNMSYGAIRAYAQVGGLIALNTIVHPSAPSIVPISFGPGGTGANQGCRDVVITANTIQYAPGAASPAIFEDASLDTFDGPNAVYGNRVIGANAYEFMPHASSGSTTSLNLTTASAGVTGLEEFRIQVEGTGSAKALKVYAVAAAAAQVLQLTKAGFLNVSDNGAAGTGVLATGNRSTSAWPDALVTGKVVGDGFVAVKQYTTGGTFTTGDANALDASWGLIRFNPATPDFEKSVTTSSGARVWVPFGGGASVVGSNTQVIFNDGGSAFGADAGLVYDKTLNVLTVAGGAGIAAVVAANGFVQSAEGFYSPYNSYQTIQAPSGGVYARSLRATSHIHMGTNAVSPTMTPGESLGAGAMHFNTGASVVEVYTGSIWRQVAFTTNVVTSIVALGSNLTISPTTGSVFAQVSSSPTFTSVTATAAALTGAGNALTLSSGYVDAAAGFATASVADNAIKAYAGGVLANTGFYIGNNSSWNKVINAGGQFVGFGVDVKGYGIGGLGFNFWNGSAYENGLTINVTISGTTLHFKGGVLVNVT